ncbi:MAG: alpha/beta hydrolase, partial [Pseudomonadota bacterium]
MLRRTFIAGGGAGVLTACATANPTPSDAAEAAFPPIGEIFGAPGRTVHATDDGRGDGPPVIMIHGASGNVRDWTFDIVPRLSAKRRVIAMDRPGFGYSERTGEDGWRPTLQAAQLRDAAREMGAEKPIIVGHSWGAAVALAWALETPEDVTGVVAVSGVTTPWGGIVPTLDALGFGSLIAGFYTRRITRTAEEGGVERFIQRAFRPQAAPSGYL